MKAPLRILYLEDSPMYVELVPAMLNADGITCDMVHVETREQYLAALAEGEFDLILADYTLPSFDGISALAIAREKCPAVPFLFISGTIGEELAIETLKRGAVDYVFKQRLSRLVPSVRRALAEAKERRERRQAEQALRQSEERYALAERGANDGLWDWDLKTNTVYFSPRWKAMLGCAESEIGNSPEEWRSRVPAEDSEKLKSAIASHLNGSTAHFENEHRIRHRNGTYRWVLSRGLAVRDADGKAYRMAGSQTDITERKLAEEQLLHNAFYDILTGLPNRALFLDRLGRVMGRARRRKDYLFAVLFIDIDRFKVVNDSLGHDKGDQLLLAVAHRLEKCLRSDDTAARLGGDEFTILLDDIDDINSAVLAADRIQKELALPFHLGGQELFTAVSIGIASSATAYDNPEDILRDADTAMYRAKALGKARYVIFDPAMHADAVFVLQVESDLRRAIERQEFFLYYQPIVSLASSKIISVEALLRWQHPQRGLISPADFIPIAEETGLIVPMGEWVLRTACVQAKAWHISGLPPISVAVNLSARQFKQKDLDAMITQILAETGLEPCYLNLELTESVIMENAAEAIETLQRLKAIGVQLVMDDFGTGYSSLSYLQRFPFNALKIDRSFMQGVPEASDNVTIVTAIITLAHSLKLNVVAEGVETEEQRTFLRSQACDELQGFLFHRPTSFEAMTQLLRDGGCLPPGALDGAEMLTNF